MATKRNELKKVVDSTKQASAKYEELAQIEQRELEKREALAKAKLDAQLAEITRLEELQKTIIADEQKLIADITNDIKQLCKKHGFWCGVKLDATIIAMLVQKAIETGEVMEIPFTLYYDNTSEEEIESTDNVIDETSTVQIDNQPTEETKW